MELALNAPNHTTSWYPEIEPRSFRSVVAFSCTGRGFCPSCGALRMAATARTWWITSFRMLRRYLIGDLVRVHLHHRQVRDEMPNKTDGPKMSLP